MNNTKQNIKPGYKKTPVGMIPEDWEVKEMGDLSKVNQGLQIPISERYTDEVEDSYFYITNEFLKEGSKKSYYIKNPSKNVLCTKDDILMTRTGNTGSVVTGVDGAFHNNFFKINFDKEVLSKEFLYDFLIHPRTQFNILVLAGNSTIPDLNHSEFYRLKIPIPPLPEQKSIADCLSTWDAGIEKLTQLLQAKKQQKKGLMQQLLTGSLRLRSASGEKFDEEWKEVRLGDYFKERNERGFNNLELLSIGENGVYPQSMSNKKDTSNANKSKYKLIEKGDIGYNTMRLWQGRLALSSLRGIVSPAYTIAIPEDNKTNSKFFSYFFKMSFVVFKFYRNSQGMVSDTLQCRYKDFKKIKVKIPSLKEQTAIAEVLQTADKEIELLEQKLAAFQQQKKGLMQVLLTGEKRLI